jgi:predicted nuclease of predicted toxin-antitoxin system
LRFLLDADLSPQLAKLFAQHGHEAFHVEQAEHGTAPDSIIGAFALDTGRCIVTGDFDFANIREFDPRRFHGIVVLTLPRNTGARYITRALEYFFERLPELVPLDGKLLIVEIGRIRVRE